MPNRERLTCKGSVLLVEDDEALRFSVARWLRALAYDVAEAATAEEARDALTSFRADVVLLDLQLPDGEAFDLLPLIRAMPSTPITFIVTGNASVGAAVRAVKEGAEDYLVKPVSQTMIVDLVASAMAARKNTVSGARPRFRGASETAREALRDPTMLALMERLDAMASRDSPTLLLGEKGAGKKTLARRLHDLGPRRERPFQIIVCADTLSVAAEARALETTAGGTLVLDGVTALEERFQKRLLGAARAHDVRVVATARIGEPAAKRGRADAFYLPPGEVLTVPALRDRRLDILVLASSLASRFAAGARVELSPRAAQRLLEHGWPGNVRELENVVQRACLLRRAVTIEEAEIRFDEARVVSPPAETDERAQIVAALEAEQGRVAAAAKRLGLPRSTLYWKLKHFGIAWSGKARPKARQGDS